MKNEELLNLLKTYSGQKHINLPRGIEFDCSLEDASKPKIINMMLSTKAAYNTNMQEDESAFEAWALIFRAYFSSVEICLLLEEGKQKETEHYHRFLYRVMNFMEQYEWFHISSFLLAEVERFKKTLVNNAFYNNCPGKDSTKISDGSQKGIEKEYEAKFSGNHESVDRRAELCKPSEKIFSQLPVGLMKGDEKTPFFPGDSAAIDLWKISSDHKLVIYELKAKRKKVGIVTELMFYASYVRDMFLKDNNTWKLSPSEDGDFRGYGDLYEACRRQELVGLEAYMLVDEIHPLLADGKVLKLMNQNSNGIVYRQKFYER